MPLTLLLAPPDSKSYLHLCRFWKGLTKKCPSTSTPRFLGVDFEPTYIIRVANDFIMLRKLDMKKM